VAEVDAQKTSTAGFEAYKKGKKEEVTLTYSVFRLQCCLIVWWFVPGNLDTAVDVYKRRQRIRESVVLRNFA
jgi:hypothetical protein